MVRLYIEVRSGWDAAAVSLRGKSAGSAEEVLALWDGHSERLSIAVPPVVVWEARSFPAPLLAVSRDCFVHLQEHFLHYLKYQIVSLAVSRGQQKLTAHEKRD